jgi:phosphocarrier protein
MNLLHAAGLSASSSSYPTRAMSSQMIQNRLGLHARPAAMFVRVANKHRADIWVEKDGERVNGKSILGLMMLAAGRGTKLVISAEGVDAEKAVRELEMLVQRRFDEE